MGVVSNAAVPIKVITHSVVSTEPVSEAYVPTHRRWSLACAFVRERFRQGGSLGQGCPGLITMRKAGISAAMFRSMNSAT